MIIIQQSEVKWQMGLCKVQSGGLSGGPLFQSYFLFIQSQQTIVLPDSATSF